MQDAEAIRLLKRGEIEGLEVLVTRYQTKAVRTAYLVIQDLSLAEDVTQETFLKLFQRIRFFDETRSFEPYLMRSIVNASLNVAKKQKRQVSLSEDIDHVAQLISKAMSVESQAESNELQAQLLEAIALLPPRQRAVVVQRYYLEMSEAEMAQALHTPAGTIKWLLNTARTRLRTMLHVGRSER